jgi:tetratricopeptide (TPR) repeat protein
LDPSEGNLFDWGTELLTHRAAEPAIEVFDKGNRLFPRSVKMLLGLAVGWYARGDYEHAAQRFFEACDLDPRDPAPYLFLGKAQSPEIAQSDGYLERMARFARLQPGNAVAGYYYAAALWKRWTGPEDRATAAQVESLLLNAVRADPNLGAAWLELGVVPFCRQRLSRRHRPGIKRPLPPARTWKKRTIVLPWPTAARATRVGPSRRWICTTGSPSSRRLKRSTSAVRYRSLSFSCAAPRRPR